MELDLEDFIEEVKFQMVELEELEEEVILDWEKRAREWVNTHEDPKKRIIKYRNSIFVKVKDDDVMAEVAAKFFKAFRGNSLDQYWKTFTLI